MAAGAAEAARVAAEEKAADKAAIAAAQRTRADALQRQEYALETRAAEVERNALAEARRRLTLSDEALEAAQMAIVDPKTAGLVAARLAERTAKLRETRDRRLPPPDAEDFVPKRRPVTVSSKVDWDRSRDGDDALDASRAGGLARERLAAASDALLLEASYLDDEKRAALLTQLQDELVAKTAAAAEANREKSG